MCHIDLSMAWLSAGFDMRLIFCVLVFFHRVQTLWFRNMLPLLISTWKIPRRGYAWQKSPVWSNLAVSRMQDSSAFERVNPRVLFIHSEKDEQKTVKTFANDVCWLIPAKIVCGDLDVIFIKAAHNLRLKISSCKWKWAHLSALL